MENKKINPGVRLTIEAHQLLNGMLKEVLNQDPEVKINLSKILSFIIQDYRERHFERYKEKIILIHRDKRKDAKDTLDLLPEDQLESILKMLEKIKKEGTPINNHSTK